MLFNSYIFVFLFLPITILCYYLFNKISIKLANFFLVIMSLWFYGYFNVKYLLFISFSIVVNFVLSFMMQKGKYKKSLLTVALLFNLGFLFYFKYYDFFITNINFIFKSSFNLKHILLPLGISFFTFQQISYCIDVYNNEVKEYKFLDYVMFVTYFPQLVAGPIVMHDELIPQFNDISKRKVNYDNLSKGLYIFILGLSKKVLLADVFGKTANFGFDNIKSLNSLDAIVVALSYTFEIYFDFSGYGDMAVGIAKMMNIDLPVNFNSPYVALNIKDFWKRWHITLTRFFTKYVYIPLGGSRKGELRTYINTMIIFLLSGIWHGANWTFVLWGGGHGLAMLFYRKMKSKIDSMHPVLRWVLLFSFVNFAWVLFRSDSIYDALRFFKRILLCELGPINTDIVTCFGGIRLLLLYLIIAFCIILKNKNSYYFMNNLKYSKINVFICCFLLILCIMSFSHVSTFLYFNF